VPRLLRDQVEGGIYHLVTRGVRKLPIFTDDRDRDRFLGLLQITADRYAWQIHAYCLMTNHFHLLVTTQDANVSAGMQYLNGRYCQWFNWRHGYEGHVVEKRFFSDLIESDRQLANVARYIVLNPVRAGICRSAAVWKWSSYSAMVTFRRATPHLSRLVLEFFHGELKRAQEEFADFVRAGEADAVD
jgi:putative transposase